MKISKLVFGRNFQQEEFMCGRFFVDEKMISEIEKIVSHIDREAIGQLSGDVHPSEMACVLTGRRSALNAENMCWGFPGYQGKGLLINARAETVLEKRTFRESVLHRRCVIPAEKFYEWDREKNKVTFFREDAPVMYLAGFYNCFQGQDCFIIITTAANRSVEKVHERMPLILEKQELEDWIYDDGFTDYALHKESPILKQYQPYVQQSLF